MKIMLVLSLLLNIAVLIPVCLGLSTGAQWTEAGYGDPTPARGILLSVYFSILVASVVLLIFRNPQSVAVLLSIQVIYKLSTPFTVGTLWNPVVISNLGIAAVHAITLYLICRVVGNPFRKS